MGNKKRHLAVGLMLVSALLFTSCSGTSGDGEKSRVDQLNEKIGAIDTGITGFSDVGAVCASFNTIFDDLQVLNSTDGIYIDQLKNKCTGFDNTYRILTEDANNAIDVVGSIFAAETSKRVADLILNADRDGALYIDQDEFFDVVSAVSQDYSSFTALSADNSYFTAGKYTYDDYIKRVEAALFNLNEAYNYYNAHTIDSSETLTVFKRYFSDSVNAMADIAQMHSETLDLISKDAEAVEAVINRMNQIA